MVNLRNLGAVKCAKARLTKVRNLSKSAVGEWWRWREETVVQRCFQRLERRDVVRRSVIGKKERIERIRESGKSLRRSSSIVAEEQEWTNGGGEKAAINKKII